MPRQMPIAVATILPALAGAALLFALPAQAQSESEAEAALSAGEERLARLLDGRVAGAPVECIQPRRNISSTTIARTAIVYGQGKTIWVQPTQTPGLLVDDSYAVSVMSRPGRICRGDVFNIVRRWSGIGVGPVTYEQFIPYTRP